MKKPPAKVRRKAVNLTIREDIVRDAKRYDINMSEVSEAAVIAATKKKKEEEWLRENMPAIEAYNERIRKHGTLIKSHWIRQLEAMQER